MVAVNKKVVWLEFGVSLSCLLASVDSSVPCVCECEFRALVSMDQFAAIFAPFCMWMSEKGCIILFNNKMHAAAGNANLFNHLSDLFWLSLVRVPYK